MEQSNYELVKDSLAAVGFPKKTFLRKTGEEIEVITYYQLDCGARSFTDWVTYIDSAGVEHIKENLSYTFDIREESPLQKTFESLASAKAAVTDMKVPSPWVERKMRILVALLQAGNSEVGVVNDMNQIVNKLKEDPDFKE